MTVSIDKETGESPRAVLISWLNDYSAGRCERADMQASFLDICKSNPEAPWEALALLDQYQRRGRIDAALARSLKSDIAQLVFGASNQTEGPRDSALKSASTADTTGSGWRKQAVTAEPTRIQRDFDPPTRPPPRPRAIAVEQAPPPTQVPAAVAAGSVLRERYELLEIIGQGEMGTVYKAFDRHRSQLPGPSRYVAIKVLNSEYTAPPGAIAELQRECYLARSLSHPSIVSVFDLDRHGDTYFIVMELLEGELLSRVLNRLDGRALARSHALKIIATIGSALVHAHQRNIVHADLKPAKVMVTDTGELKLLDFGFARRHTLDPWISEPGISEPGSGATLSASTPAYASGERINGEARDPGDDVYSLACLAYELLSGVHPFGGRPAPLARAHGRHPGRISGLNNKQWHALQHALRWTRAERGTDITGLIAALGCTQPAQRVGSPQELIAAVGNTGGRSSVGVTLLGALLTLAALATFTWGQFGDLITAKLGIESARVEAMAKHNAEPTTRLAPAGEADIRESDPPQLLTELATKPAAVNTTAQPDNSAMAGGSPDAAIGAPVGTLEFEKDTFVATESDGIVRLSVKRSGSTRRPAKFRWTLHSNSAEAGADFANIGPGTEEIAAGARTAVLAIPLVADGLVENTELFVVELSQLPDGPAIGEQARAAVILVDDD